MDTANKLGTIVITVFFLIGAAGNVAALFILYKTAKRRNRKHLLMLRCLATNDLVAQVGMLVLIYLKKFNVLPDIWACVGFVLLRAFGLGSGCVAFVMALERWLALTRPFLYHQPQLIKTSRSKVAYVLLSDGPILSLKKLVTYQMLKRFLCGLWMSAVFLTYLPLFGFGLYYSNDGTSDKGNCTRFRYATEVKDKVYAYIFFVFGLTLCICIALCNSAVACELSRIRSQGKILVRRVSRSMISNRVGSARYQTPEEVAFAKLMAIICVIFIVCWVLQVISVPIAQFFPGSRSSKTFTKIADALLCVYFTLDPFVYVLQNYMEGRFILPCCFFKKIHEQLTEHYYHCRYPNFCTLNATIFYYIFQYG
ncbi:hypothetical protein NQ317_010594 [Molorchus minor]|uniref:G-protein coupled receptors family 1 profile domain-containing protein n=1 Tax=Molorchus minor TaxID=1323400 RepID=A0ABQ9JTJ0_9CUCU|nr:hypothetical protein NQ317_010594 [Molorchus minor]